MKTLLVALLFFQTSLNAEVSTHDGKARANISTPELNALYLKELKEGKYDSNAILRWDREQLLMDAGVLTDAEDMLTKADKALVTAIQEFTVVDKKGGKSARLPGADGVAVPRLCSASRLHTARMAEDQVEDHYGFIPDEGSPYEWKDRKFPMRKDQILKFKFAAGKEISASIESFEARYLEGMADLLYKKPTSQLNEDEKLRVAAWTCIEGWRTRSSTGTHYRNLEKKHEHMCFTMVMNPATKSHACNGIFIH